MKKKSITKLFSALLSFLIAIFMIITIFATLSTGSKSVFGHHLFLVVSGSMTGTIDKGELIITKSTPRQSLKQGDIITFLSNDWSIYGKPNTHRITRIENGLFFTKGDANPTEDTNPVSYDAILGKVIFHNKLLGLLIQKLSHPFIMFLFILLPLSFMVFSEFKNTKKLLKHSENEG